MKIYIASSLKNYKKVIELRDRFLKHDIVLSYDWAGNYHPGEHEDLEEVAKKEYQGICNCDLLFFICPGGRGAHFELGVAYEQSKKIIIWRGNDDIAFYSLPEIESFYTEDDAFRRIIHEKERFTRIYG